MNGTEVFKTVEDAVAARMLVLIPNIAKLDGDYVYGGSRTRPERLGWRFIQRMGTKHPSKLGLSAPITVKPEDVVAGKHDDDLVANYHDAAGAEHWYLYEKDYE